MQRNGKVRVVVVLTTYFIFVNLIITFSAALMIFWQFLVTNF